LQTSGGRSVGIVRSRTKATKFVFMLFACLRTTLDCVAEEYAVAAASRATVTQKSLTEHATAEQNLLIGREISTGSVTTFIK
jgi:hypothetical protein